MTTAPTTTVEIDSIDTHGKPRHVAHAAMRSLPDAFSFIASHAAAPVNRWARQRIEHAGGGEVQIGEITAVIAMLP
jgi:hypothetical protein